jgi:hypothetical protein
MCRDVKVRGLHFVRHCASAKLLAADLPSYDEEGCAPGVSGPSAMPGIPPERPSITELLAFGTDALGYVWQGCWRGFDETGFE